MSRIAGVFALSAILAAAAPDPLAGHRWHDRIVLVFADAPGEPALLRQRETFARNEVGLRRRDTIVVEIVGGRASPGFDGPALRQMMDRDQGFLVVLIGKDGGVKVRSETVLPIGRLFATIDAMPMARAEAAKAGASQTDAP
jgi:hypothetical protein